MTLAEMEQAIDLLVRDKSLSKQFGRMIRDTILEIAADFELPALRRSSPLPFPVTTEAWLWSLPSIFHKKLFRCVDGAYSPVNICRSVDDLNNLDLAHEITGERVTNVAVVDGGVDNQLAVFPRANDTLNLWFYERPTLPEKPDDVLKCIPEEFHYRVVVSKCILKNFRLFTDGIDEGPHKSVMYWEGLYQQGLYGSPRGDIGLINYLAKLNGPPRRHGGRDPLP